MEKKLEMRLGRGVAEWEKKDREGREIKRGRDRGEIRGGEWQRVGNERLRGK